ncbi:MAG: type II secretion system minor pseudopilin GspJ [Gammaproteobacteria bacterium]|nr:type II secretion system minor pseudopilin GspJ [Gammaproteobacteria bacterium]
MAIFGLIGIVSGQLLLRVLEAQQLGEARADKLADLQRALTLFERDVLQTADRPIRDEFGDPQPPLRLAFSGSLELTRHGWGNPLGWPRSELQRVGWELDGEGRLQRQFWNVLDRAQDSEPQVQTVLEEVRGFELQLLDANGGIWNAWPPDDVAAGLTPLQENGGEPGEEPPELVAMRVEIDLPPFGRIERLLPMPMPVPTLARGLPEDGTPDDGEGPGDAEPAPPDEGGEGTDGQ